MENKWEELANEIAQNNEEMIEKARLDALIRRCNFCGKTEHQVACLIAGPTVFICEECIQTCNEIIFQHLRNKNEELRKMTETPQHDLHCNDILRKLSHADLVNFPCDCLSKNTPSETDEEMRARLDKEASVAAKE